MTAKERTYARSLALTWGLLALWAFSAAGEHGADHEWFWFGVNVVSTIFAVFLAVSYWHESR